MADHTGIEWADATWNPIVGCSLVSPGCTNCYAMRVAARLAANPATPHYAGTVERVKARSVWTGFLSTAPTRVWSQPLRWQRPRRIFVNSMGDLFHESAPDALIDKALAMTLAAPQHRYLVLTKRPQRMRAHMIALAKRSPEPCPPPNLWLGVSAEDQLRAAERLPLLRDTPAGLRFLSAEPLLGPLDLPAILGPQLAGLDWVITGGESGPGARPADPDWFRRLRDDCAKAGVPFFFKQWGDFAPRGDEGMIWQGKRNAGRALDGRNHDAIPEG